VCLKPMPDARCRWLDAGEGKPARPCPATRHPNEWKNR
jgi:hypothetical protein